MEWYKDTIIKKEEAGKCIICGKLTHWFDLDLDAYFHSKQCLKAYLLNPKKTTVKHFVLNVIS